MEAHGIHGVQITFFKDKDCISVVTNCCVSRQMLSVPFSVCSFRKLACLNCISRLSWPLLRIRFAQWVAPAEDERLSKSGVKVFIVLLSSLLGSWVSRTKFSIAFVWWCTSTAIVLFLPSGNCPLFFLLQAYGWKIESITFF